MWSFAGGVVLGLVIGLVVGPVFRVWLAWHEWRDAARQARWTDDMLELLDSHDELPRHSRSRRA